jgi:hypothetical protein
MEAREGVGIVREFKSVLRAFREGVCDGVGTVISWHEFCNTHFAFAFVILAPVFCGEHD